MPGVLLVFRGFRGSAWGLRFRVLGCRASASLLSGAVRAHVCVLSPKHHISWFNSYVSAPAAPITKLVHRGCFQSVLCCDWFCQRSKGLFTTHLVYTPYTLSPKFHQSPFNKDSDQILSLCSFQIRDERAPSLSEDGVDYQELPLKYGSYRKS